MQISNTSRTATQTSAFIQGSAQIQTQAPCQELDPRDDGSTDVEAETPIDQDPSGGHTAPTSQKTFCGSQTILAKTFFGSQTVVETPPLFRLNYLPHVTTGWCLLSGHDDAD